ncbi:MAG: hypothetical protein HYU75_20930, partial [Betaproteobacteria bacterium]|nr:hypothetical protein [Betaproteobacteria bacterium]
MTEETENSLAVLDQYTASFTNGFSATVFRLGGVPYFAIRGSNDLADFAIADLFGITAQGAARAQAVEMYRYWRRLTTPLGEQVNYSQAELKYLAGVLLPSLIPLTIVSSASSLIAAAVADRGLGVLPPDAQVIVTGHSLGGHLAQLFYQMFPLSVSPVYTYNGAGVGGAAYELAERLLRLIGRSADVPVAGITNVIAEHGFNLTAGFGRFLGETHRVFNEKSVLPWENHFIDKLT